MNVTHDPKCVCLTLLYILTRFVMGAILAVVKLIRLCVDVKEVTSEALYTIQGDMPKTVICQLKKPKITKSFLCSSLYQD